MPDSQFPDSSYGATLTRLEVSVYCFTDRYDYINARIGKLYGLNTQRISLVHPGTELG